MWRYNGFTKQPERLPSEGEEASSSAEEQPSCFDTTEFGKFLDVGKDKLEVRYTGNGLHDNDVGSIQGNHSIPRKQLIYYYEMTVVDAGERGLMAIGFAEKGFKLSRHPGWEPNSYGYHSDDGKKLTGGVTPSRNNGGEEYGPTYSSGDIVGAGIYLERQDMFFTKNGRNLGIAFRNVLKTPLYPTIGLHSRNEQVKVNFGQKPFEFDLDSLVTVERSRQEAAVQSVHVPAGVSHQVVRDYLLHYGYANTLNSFVDSAGLASADASAPSTSGNNAAEETLLLRHALREKFMAGRVEEACRLLEKSPYKNLLGFQSGDSTVDQNLDVYFFVKCLAFIELIREGSVEEAVEYARHVLSPLRGVFAARSSAYDALLADVVALLAYVEPEASPMRQLLDKDQREAVADVVNSAILEASGPPSEQRQSVLARLLMQLVALQEELHSANGGHGQVFRLLDHLMPVASRHPNVANGSTANGHATNGVALME